jgi:hypothetical protein
VVGSGRISVLVSTEMRTLLFAVRELPADVNREIRKHTKIVVEPVWQEAVRGNVTDRMQTRVLADTARVSVSDSNVMLRSGGIGKMADGTPKSRIASAVEFGADPRFSRTVVSVRGRTYVRRTKAQFKLPRSRGYVVYPAAREVIPRIGSLWAQTAARTVHETFEKGGARG